MLESVVIQQSAEAVAQQNTSDKNEFGFGKTMKNTAIRTLRTVDESFRIMEEGAKDVRKLLDLVGINLDVAKGEAIIDGVASFMSKGLSAQDAQNLMKSLRND